MNDKSIVTCLALIFTVIGATVIHAILSGWVLSLMWAWFIVPKFQLPPLNVTEAIGVSLVVGFLTIQYSSSNGKERSLEGKAIDLIMYVVGRPLLALLIAWIVLQFMN